MFASRQHADGARIPDVARPVKPSVSLIVPLRNEAPEVAAALVEIALGGFDELIVVDSSAFPVVAGEDVPLPIRWIAGSGTRGACLAKAVSQARGDVFFFLHADSRPPGNAVEIVREALARGASSGAFSLAYAGGGWRMRWVAAWANLRSRFLRLPFGDQGLFCLREAYQSAGGFRDMAVCEDVDLVRRLRRTGHFVVRPEVVTTSARRYQDRGVFRQVLRVWVVLGGYLLGVSPERLGRLYYGGAVRPSRETEAQRAME
jgi:glycosyltransferase involved in cell wall biosynthesis